MRNWFSGSRWSGYLETVKHIDTKAKQELYKKNNSKKKLVKQSSIVSFVGSKKVYTTRRDIHDGLIFFTFNPT
eukprot:6213019-Ditylum_brightwellii.AAC.1